MIEQNAPQPEGKENASTEILVKKLSGLQLDSTEAENIMRILQGRGLSLAEIKDRMNPEPPPPDIYRGW